MKKIFSKPVVAAVLALIAVVGGIAVLVNYQLTVA